jgi:MoxR-like ATPase
MMSEFTFESFKNYVSKYVVGQDDIIKLIYVGINAARRSKTVPAFLLRGPPGAGKTMITQIVADYFNANYVFIQTTLNTTEDELIYKYVPSEQTRSGVRIQYGPLPDALIKSREKITVLTIDEFDKTRPSADALLLDYLQNARVSFRIDDREDVIVGNKDNLIVFITSNDNREFSEPLLRRVITINFKLPDPKDVEKLLRRHFNDDKIVKTLTTIYIAGLTTQLTKPITIQELIQLGYAMTIMPDVDFNQLLLSFVVKNTDDLYKLNESLEQLDPKELRQHIDLPDVGSTIINKVNDATIAQEQTTEQQTTTTVQQLLTRIKLPINNVIKSVDNVDKINDTIEATFNAKINTKSFYEYDTIIKTLNPEPTDRPDVLGKFKVILDDTLRLTSNEPLSLMEVNPLHNQMNIEAYVEDYVYLNGDHKDIIRIVNNNYNELKFTYYTKDVIVAVDKDVTTDRPLFVLRFDRVKGHLYKVKIYDNKEPNRSSHQYSLISELYDHYQINNVVKTILNEVTYRRDMIMNYEFFKSDLYNRLVNFVNDVKGVFDLRVRITIDEMESTALLRKDSKSDCSVNYAIFAYDEVSSKTGYVDFKFKYVEVVRSISTDQNVFERMTITNDVVKIVSKYVGEYDILDGLKKFADMTKELGDYAKKLCEKLPEVLKK